MDCWWNVSVLMLMLATAQIPRIASENHRAKRLTDVACDSGTTKITSPNYYQNDSSGWCGAAVGLPSNDYYNFTYRQECQRWLGGALPDSVAQAELSYCYEFTNATVVYRMGICCHGTVTDLRCFNGQRNDLWWSSAFYDGSMSYVINYEDQLVTCQPDEVCQNTYTYYGSKGIIANVTMTKGCAKAADCSAVNDPTNGTCKSCVVATPSCATCCSTPFCNYDFQYFGWLEPAVCPVPKYPCNDYPCQNGGICDNTDYINGDEGYGNYTCSCPIQWGGKNCTENRTLCTFGNPCLNGGTCYDYSDLALGDYRCYCSEPFVGDRCELRSNLTCNASDANYRAFKQLNSGADCTQLASLRRGHPDHVLGWPNYIQQLCGSDSHTAAYRIEFELQSCSRGNGLYDWTDFHSCCFNRTVCSSQPCLNGGTCYDYGDVTPGDYRCECPAPFIGDNCELRSNLTCNASDQFYQVRPPTSLGYHMVNDVNCTTWVETSRNKPGLVYPWASDTVNYDCISSIRRLSDGHQFVQGVDGQINADKFKFEATYCGRNDRLTFSVHYLCCPTCLSSPCQNGGYCQQVTYDEFVCKCTAGYNGKFCENRVAICSVSGDPHYRTFDGKAFEYQGICKHNLASPCSASQQPYFNVFVKNENRENVSKAVSFPSFVEIVYNFQTVRISRISALVGLAAIPVIVTLNRLTIQVPYKTSEWSIYYNGQYVRFEATSGLSVGFDGYWSITVNIPTTLHVGTMCGLCGNNDNNPNNDLTMANGTYVGNLPTAGNLVGDGYVVSDPAQTNPLLCPAPPPPPPCDPVPSSYRATCELINDTSNVFSTCINRIGLATASVFADNCIMDACFTNGSTICSSLKTFVDICAFSGVSLPCSNWQTASGCSADTFCPAGMIYQCSTSACPATCADPSAPNFCPFPNKDACVCPPDQLLYNGTCTSSCPVGCLDPNLQLRMVGDQWSEPGCKIVRCEECVNCSAPVKTVATVECPAGTVCVNDNTCTPLPVTTTKRTTSTQRTTVGRTTRKSTARPGKSSGKKQRKNRRQQRRRNLIRKLRRVLRLLTRRQH